MSSPVADFSHLKKLEVGKDAIARYELVELEGEPWIEGVFAGESNKLYHNALLKHANRNNRRIRAGKLSRRELAENRDHDRELFPVCVLKRWGRMMDSQGKDADFSVANCTSFLDALPNDIMDDVRNYFSNPVNFRQDNLESEVDVEGLGNSSRPDSAGTSATSETAGQ